VQTTKTIWNEHNIKRHTLIEIPNTGELGGSCFFGANESVTNRASERSCGLKGGQTGTFIGKNHDQITSSRVTKVLMDTSDSLFDNTGTLSVSEPWERDVSQTCVAFFIDRIGRAKLVRSPVRLRRAFGGNTKNEDRNFDRFGEPETRSGRGIDRFGLNLNRVIVTFEHSSAVGIRNVRGQTAGLGQMGNLNSGNVPRTKPLHLLVQLMTIGH